MQFFTNCRLTCRNFVKYLPLLQNLISRELKSKYRESVLGYVWCILNPLLVMLILNFVFSNMFRSNIANYPVYLFTGRMFFSFITGATQGACRSIVQNSSLMRKTRVPNYIFTLANLCSSVVDMLFTLIAFVLVLLFTHTPISIHALYLPVLMIQCFLFCMGVGFFLACAFVFIRDTAYIYGVFITGWMYLTPLFYPMESLPELLRVWIARLNPAYFYIEMSRQIFMYNQWPTPMLMLKGWLVAILACIVGLLVYQRSKDKFILYV